MLHFFSRDFTFTKRQIGVLMFVVGVLGNVALLIFDLIRKSDHGIGPAQEAGMLALAAGAIIGLTLIPLGNAKA